MVVTSVAAGTKPSLASKLSASFEDVAVFKKT